jgi:hypothetical protein
MRVGEWIFGTIKLLFRLLNSILFAGARQTRTEVFCGIPRKNVQQRGKPRQARNTFVTR